MEKTLRILNGVYYSIFMMTVLTAVGVTILTYVNANPLYVEESSSLGRYLSSGLILFILISIPLAMWMFHKNTKEWSLIPDKFEKFRAYKKGAVIRLWVIGIGLIGGIVLIYLLRSTNMMYCAVISAIALYFVKPTAKKMEKELNIQEEEEE